MFRIHQIITFTQLVRSLAALTRHLQESGEPLLITQKGGRSLVIMDAESFDAVMCQHLREDGADVPQGRHDVLSKHAKRLELARAL